MAFFRGPTTLTDNLIRYYDIGNAKSFVSGSTTLYDVSLNKNNGTLSGTTYDVNYFGSLSFNGAGDYISIPKSNITNSFTINMWLNCTGTGTVGQTGYIGLVNRFNGVNNQRNRFLLNGNFNRLYLQLRISSITYDIFSDIFKSILNKNTMCTVTYNGSEVNFYVNGYSVMSTPYSLSGNLDTSTTTPTIGWGADSPDYYLKGNVYTYQIYDIGHTSEQVLHNFNVLKNRFI
jgi:hypothetical protein